MMKTNRGLRHETWFALDLFGARFIGNSYQKQHSA
jgi:hypothetical protein